MTQSRDQVITDGERTVSLAIILLVLVAFIGWSLATFHPDADPSYDHVRPTEDAP